MTPLIIQFSNFDGIDQWFCRYWASILVSFDATDHQIQQFLTPLFINFSHAYYVLSSRWYRRKWSITKNIIHNFLLVLLFQTVTNYNNPKTIILCFAWFWNTIKLWVKFYWIEKLLYKFSFPSFILFSFFMWKNNGDFGSGVICKKKVVVQLLDSL